MKWNSQQVAEYLNISKTSVKRLVKEGKLVDLAENGTGKRHALRIDDKAVRALRKAGDYLGARRPHRDRIQAAAPDLDVSIADVPPGPRSILQTLTRIEQRLARVEKLWS